MKKKIKDKLIKIGLNIIGVPAIMIGALAVGFGVVGFMFLIPNFIGGIWIWIITGELIEIIEWSMVWTRSALVISFIAFLYLAINLYGKEEVRGSFV